MLMQRVLQTQSCTAYTGREMSIEPRLQYDSDG